MTGRTRDGSGRRASDPAGDGPEADDFVHQDRATDPLLDAVGAFAREEEVEIGTYAADNAHVMSEVARELAVQKILTLQARERAAGLAPEEQQGQVARARPTDLPRRAAPTRSRLSRFALMSAGVVAAALVLGLWMRPAARNSDRDPRLPAYSIAARGGIKEARGGALNGADDARTTAESQRLLPESRLVVAVRPEAAVAGTVAARAFVVQGADVTEIAPNAQVAPTGAIELRLHGSDVIGSRHGIASLRIIVGRPDALRALAPASVLASDMMDGRWRVLTVPLELARP